MRELASCDSAVQVREAAQRGHDRVEDALGHLVAVAVEHGVGGHQVADLADEQQRAAGQGDLLAGGRGVGPVGVHRPGEGLAALGDLLGEGALHQPQPVAVAEHLVLGVDGGDGVLEVHDRGDRGLEQQVLDAGAVGGADRVVAVDLDLDVQAVVDEQHGLGRAGVAAVADQLGRVGEPDDVVLDGHGEAVAVHGVRRGVGVRARRRAGSARRGRPGRGR